MLLAIAGIIAGWKMIEEQPDRPVKRHRRSQKQPKPTLPKTEKRKCKDKNPGNRVRNASPNDCVIINRPLVIGSHPAEKCDDSRRCKENPEFSLINHTRYG